jgi:FimV-like protein
MRLTLRFVVVLLSIGVGLGQPAPSQADSYFHFTLGKMHQFREEYSKALAEFRKALEEDPGSVGLRIEYADALLQSGDIAQAVEVCQETISRAPERVEPHLLLGRIYYNTRSQEGMRAKALEEFEEVLRLEPDQPEAVQAAAEMYFEAQEYEKSADFFRRLRQVAPAELAAYYSEAQALIELKRYDDAIEVLKKGLEIRDDIPNYLVLLAELYTRNGDLEAAARVYERGLAHGPDPRLNEGLARTLVGLGRGEEAVPILERMTAMLPHNADLKLDLARAYRQAGSLDRAQEVLEEIHSTDSSNLQIQYELASVLSLKGEVDQAADMFEALLDSETGTARSFRPLFMTNLAWLRQEQKRYDEAIELLKQVIEANPDDLDVRLRLLRVYQAADRVEDALVLSAELQEKEGTDPYVIIARGQVLASAGRVDEAIGLLKDSASSSSNPEIFYVAASQVYLSEERYVDAQAVVKEGLAGAPDSERLRFQLAAAYERQKDYSSAEEEFRRLIAANPESAEALNYLGYMFAEQGIRLTEAQELIQRAVDLEPRNGAYLDSLGWVYFKQNRLDEAEEHLREAARLEAHDPVILEHLGDLLVSRGETDEARRLYEQSISRAEKEEEAQRVREKLEKLGVPSARW